MIEKIKRMSVMRTYTCFMLLMIVLVAAPATQAIHYVDASDPENVDCIKCHTRNMQRHMFPSAACTTCHSPDMSTLTLKNGIAIPIEQSVPLCAQCHKEIYQAWREGKHGISSVNCAECHNPHLKTSPAVPSENPLQLKLITLMLAAVGMFLSASLATVLVTLKLREK